MKTKRQSSMMAEMGSSYISPENGFVYYENPEKKDSNYFKLGGYSSMLRIKWNYVREEGVKELLAYASYVENANKNIKMEEIGNKLVDIGIREINADCKKIRKIYDTSLLKEAPFLPKEILKEDNPLEFVKAFTRDYNEIVQGEERFKEILKRNKESLRINIEEMKRKEKDPKFFINQFAPSLSSFFPSYFATVVNETFMKFLKEYSKLEEAENHLEEYVLECALEAAKRAFAESCKDNSNSKDIVNEKGIVLNTKNVYGDSSEKQYRDYWEKLQKSELMQGDLKDYAMSVLGMRNFVSEIKTLMSGLETDGKTSTIKEKDIKDIMNIGATQGLRTAGGRFEELLVSAIVDNLVKSGVKGVSTVFKNNTLKADSIQLFSTAVGVDSDAFEKMLEDKIKQINNGVTGNTLAESAKNLTNMIDKVLDELDNNAVITLQSTKSYNLGSNFRGFHGGDMTLDEVIPKLENAGVPGLDIQGAKKCLAIMRSTLQGGAFNGQYDTDVKNFIKTQMIQALGTFLFDDWIQSTDNESAGDHVMYVFSLNGIQVPLSVLIYGAGLSLQNATIDDVNRFFQVSLKSHKNDTVKYEVPISKEETTEFSKFREVWKDQAMERSRVEGADVTFKFMTNFKRFIIDLCKGYV